VPWAAQISLAGVMVQSLVGVRRVFLKEGKGTGGNVGLGETLSRKTTLGQRTRQAVCGL